MNKNVIFNFLWHTVIFYTCLLIGSNNAVFLNHWAVQIYGGYNTADAIAKEHGFKNLGKVCIHTVVLLISKLKFQKQKINK